MFAISYAEGVTQLVVGRESREVVKPRWGVVSIRYANPGCAARPWALESNTFGVKSQSTMVYLKRRRHSCVMP
jgi:hypothetical protein